MKKGIEKKDLSEKLEKGLNELEYEIKSKINDQDFTPKSVIKARYPMYYKFPKTLNPYIKKGIDDILEKYDLPIMGE